MLQIVRFFLGAMLVFCLTIGTVYADQQQIVLPQIVIDLSSVGEHIYQQQAMLWLFAGAVGCFLTFFAYLLLNRSGEKSGANQGDAHAKVVSLLWMVFLILIVAGMSLPTLRVLLAITK